MRNHKIFASCALAMALAALPAYADVKAGVEAWGQGDFDTALANWRLPAQSGDADAQFNLGQAYRFGRGVPMDMKAAEDWFRRATLLGHVRAEDNLGLILFQRGAYEEAFPLLEKSAKRGDPRAQYVLGTALFNGDLIAKDWVRAYALILRASASGLDRATQHLSEMQKFIPADTQAEGQRLADRMAAHMQASVGQVVQAPALPPATPPTPPNPSLLPAPTDVAQTALPPGAGAATEASDAPAMIAAAEPKPSAAPAEPSGMPEPIAPAQSVAATRAKAAAPRHVSKTTRKIGGQWHLQLGAFRSAEAARELVGSAKKQSPSLGRYTLTTQTHGGLKAVLAGPIADRTTAMQLCAGLRKAGRACLVIKG